MKTIRFGIIGCGLMGREFASATARWCHLLDSPARPQIVSICNRSEKPFAWFKSNFPTITQITHDYQEVLANDDVDAVYIALPHHLHERVYIDAIKAGKHLMGEKPFGIDLDANRAILEVAKNNPEVFVRCVSQFPYFPAVQRIGKMIDDKAFGQIIEVQTGFLHSSDLDTNKPINWKRKIQFNGAYGVLGDLGMHVCHVPIRAGWRPLNVRAVLNNIVTQRYEAKGSDNKVPCQTWDNATLLIETQDTESADRFPWILRTHRIAPGEKNSWYIEILGTQCSARWNSRDPKTLQLLESNNPGQAWQSVQTGYETAFPTITGPIFEFGFTDALLQMWAAYCYELVNDAVPSRFASCVTVNEVAVTHQIFTAALESANAGTTEPIHGAGCKLAEVRG